MTVNCERRMSSTGALQSLMLMNNDAVLKEAEHFAQRIRKETPAEFARDPGLAKVTTVEALASFYRAESRGLIRPTTIDRAADALRAQEV